jgi:hypothetical protein
MEGSGSVHELRIRRQIQEAQKDMDPDAEHWFLHYLVKFGKEGSTQ